jgi:AraC-like DNA-binding protein
MTIKTILHVAAGAWQEMHHVCQFMRLRQKVVAKSNKKAKKHSLGDNCDEFSSRKKLAPSGDNRSAGSKLEKIVLERLPPIPHLTVCARLLSTTPRTLHRRLIEEGTSYREIVESIRHRMALKLLRKGSSIKEVTYFLGYADIASFRRAFRRWEGMAPSDWSARVQEPAGESR